MPETAPAVAPAAPAAAAPAPAATSAAPEAKAPEKQLTLLGTEAPAKPAAAAAPAATEAPAEYKLEVPAGSAFDAKHVEGLVEWAKTNKVAPDVAQAVLARDASRAAADAAQADELKATALANLKAAYPPDTLHDLDVAVTGFIRANFGDRVAEFFRESGLVFDRQIFDAFAKIASKGRESPMVKTGAAPAHAPSAQKQAFPKSPINWTEAERAEWVAAGSPKL